MKLVALFVSMRHGDGSAKTTVIVTKHSAWVGITCRSVKMRHNAMPRELGKIADGISAILSERSRLYRAEYPCHSPSQQRWFTLQIARFEWENQLRVITVHRDVATSNIRNAP
jgi:hypothetical protein